MILQILPGEFSVCQVADAAGLDLSQPFTFAARTDEEISLVCPTAFVPSAVLAREDHWRALRVQGPLDFSLTGILAGIASVLADAQIPIFAVSTFNTDYILVRTGALPDALDALRRRGYAVKDA